MPITGNDREEMASRLKGNWRLDDGHYVVQIEDVNICPVIDGRKPLCWDLLILNSQRKIEKFHWIDKKGGVLMLINDLQSLGLEINADNAINACNSLIGSKIEIEMRSDGEHDNITFLRKIIN
ncbi:hypothetical protein RJD24_09995 [Bacillaceae bacterium IKA-2]|nr:hypothetical protein RJD24_09995 [Bacillaceae bacterium IKA-2]